MTSKPLDTATGSVTIQPHAVDQLRQRRIAISTKPFRARGGDIDRCNDCQLARHVCICQWRPALRSQAGFCLIMHHTEMLKPSNTGRLIADVLPQDTYAYQWSRTEPDPDMLALLQQPHWQPYIIFPANFVAPHRVVTELPATHVSVETQKTDSKRPLFVLLDATWQQARKMFRKSPWLGSYPVLSLAPHQPSRYKLRKVREDNQLCTAEVASLLLHLANETTAAQALDAYFDLFNHHYWSSRHTKHPDTNSSAHQYLNTLTGC